MLTNINYTTVINSNLIANFDITFNEVSSIHLYIVLSVLHNAHTCTNHDMQTHTQIVNYLHEAHNYPIIFCTTSMVAFLQALP